ncbi:hypothetical protein C882_1415 [Caenispirillum salinarum AK4]|uniref:Uncharacterized protein n=1 Tax=Caenispirillum salinarum AK4 TaxID=1238182 RepID=K9GS44_9PROT|nr:hypothetical protein C882_1415 [Caenispirillum salinarum AK4]
MVEVACGHAAYPIRQQKAGAFARPANATDALLSQDGVRGINRNPRDSARKLPSQVSRR